MQQQVIWLWPENCHFSRFGRPMWCLSMDDDFERIKKKKNYVRWRTRYQNSNINTNIKFSRKWKLMVQNFCFIFTTLYAMYHIPKFHHNPITLISGGNIWIPIDVKCLDVDP
jgi:hypothetical protein